MDRRYLVTCMPTSEIAHKIYFEVLKPLLQGAERLGLISYLDVPIPEEFDREIRTWIHLSNGVIAIVDKAAPNVFYEVGVAVGFGKPVILISPTLAAVPAMLRARNVILYKARALDPEDLSNKLAPVLKATLQGAFIDQRFQDHTAVLLKQSGSDGSDGSMPEVLAKMGIGELEIGIEKYRSHSYEEAIFYFESAMKSGNHDADAYFYLADSYFLLGESLRPGERQRSAYQKMQHFAREGGRLHERDKRLHKTLGLACMKLGDFDRAERIFTDLLREDPEYIVAAYNLACLHALQKRRSDCLRFLSEVFSKNREWRYLARLDPDFDGVWKDELIQRVMFPCSISF